MTRCLRSRKKKILDVADLSIFISTLKGIRDVLKEKEESFKKENENIYSKEVMF